MDPITAMMLAGGVGQAAQGLFQGGLGVVQGIRANQIRKNTVRPDYNIPQAMMESLATSRSAYADPRMAGQQYFLDQIGANQAAGTRGAYQMGGSAAERQNAALMSAQLANQGTNQLAMQAAREQMQDRQVFLNQLGQMTGQQEKQWQWNEQQPYMDKMAAAQRESDASNKNIYGAMQSLGGAASGIGGAMSKTGGTSPYKPAVTYDADGNMVTDPEATTSLLNQLIQLRIKRAGAQ